MNWCISTYKIVLRLIYIIPFVVSLNAVAQLQSSTEKLDSILSLFNTSSIKADVRFNALYRLTWDEYLFKKPDSALLFSEHLVQFSVQSELLAEQAKVYNLRGIAFSLLGNSTEALLNYEKTVKIRRDLHDKKGLSSVLANIGIIYSDNGLYRKAIEYLTNSLVLKEELNDMSGIIASHNNLGNVYQRSGELDKALYHFHIARELIEEFGNPKMNAQSALNIANVYFSTGFLAQAHHYYTIALTYFKSVEENKGLANVLNNLGLLYTRLANNKKAIELYQESFTLYDEMNYLAGKATALMNIGHLEMNSGKLERANETYYKALEVYAEMEDWNGQSMAHLALGSLSIEKGELEVALKHFEACINLEKKLEHQKGVLESKAHYGYTLTLQGKISLGLVILLEAYQEAQQNEWSGESNRIADYLFKIYKSKQPEKAIAYLFHKIKYTNEKLKTTYFQLSEYEKELYFKTVYREYNDLIAFTMRNGDKYAGLKDYTLNTVLMIKGLSLKSSTSLRKAIFESGDTLLIHDFEKWLELKKSSVKAKEKGLSTEAMDNEAMLIEQSLIQRSAELKNYYHSFSVNWKALQEQLLVNEAVVEFIQYKDIEKKSNHYAAILIKKNSKSPEIIELCEEIQLIAFLGDFRGNNLNYVKNLYGTLQQPKSSLYKLIWMPLAKSLKGIEAVYYSPAGLLHKVCFAALADEKGRLLLDKISLRQVNTALETIHKSPTNQLMEFNKMMLVGGVDYSTSPSAEEVWKYLPATLIETQKIHEIVSANNVQSTVLVGNEAQESIVKSLIVNQKFIHIATHGYFYPDPDLIKYEIEKQVEDESEEIEFRGSTTDQNSIRSGNYASWNFVNNKNPLMRSGLVLAGANDVWQRNALEDGEDGILTAQEVSNLDLRNTKLVVLSACETGLGDIKGSEGVFGLQRAFKMAGAEYLIMSLWQVPDKETAEFMELFYKNLVKVKDIPKAFNLTQQVMRKKYDPYFWAAFVLIN
jgi:CHAT domain-containing protein